MQELRILAAEMGATESCCARVEPRVAHGNPSIEILSASAELHASLIVLGATNRPAYRALPVIEQSTGYLRMLAVRSSRYASQLRTRRTKTSRTWQAMVDLCGKGTGSRFNERRKI